MSRNLGTIEELPAGYVDEMAGLGVVPLWPSLRQVLPHGRPHHRTLPHLWAYAEVRPLLMRSGELTPMEKAERRVLVLANPGLGLETMRATPSIYLGLQLILPGKTAPNHRHTPSAVRLVVEGEGGFTTVEGRRLPMEKGDLILTPAGLWHQHGHSGEDPVVWLDVLDLPLVHGLEASYATEAPPQAPADAADGAAAYGRGGLVSYASLGRHRGRYPVLRYPWREVRRALLNMAAGLEAQEPVHLAYVNPATGRSCLPVLGLSARMLRPGEDCAPPRRSASAACHVIEGQGGSEVDGVTLEWGDGDTFAVPTHAQVRHRAAGRAPAFLFQVDDAPLHRAMGIFEEFAAAP
jgi:gentisate 1,2-dioxygenase